MSWRGVFCWLLVKLKAFETGPIWSHSILLICHHRTSWKSAHLKDSKTGDFWCSDLAGINSNFLTTCFYDSRILTTGLQFVRAISRRRVLCHSRLYKWSRLHKSVLLPFCLFDELVVGLNIFWMFILSSSWQPVGTFFVAFYTTEFHDCLQAHNFNHRPWRWMRVVKDGGKCSKCERPWSALPLEYRIITKGLLIAMVMNGRDVI